MTDAEKYVVEHGDKIVGMLVRIASGKIDMYRGDDHFDDAMRGLDEFKFRVCPSCSEFHVGSVKLPWACMCAGAWIRIRGKWIEIPASLVEPFYRMLS